ncbi:hypothetical protein [Nitrospirillum viridazoti]|uniref:GlsB/YeaQ/YmgE family stress response membrane protein n=1 Tax=Nitrospirillum viridazoti CBAmc TaxID=1441467 RepID=A0A248JWA3_9PROT|nr:hypothetical protein [Nitrospirillum amazonense]ASG22985.1 hypothetical protein Y958_19090 [Nitrospirillum amazonense CBAmc]TWB38694.1 hypothetical protein FBZ91_10620 [Nitrospirillum amazonense]
MQLLFCVGLGVVLGLVCGRIVNGRPGFFTVEALLGAIGSVMGAFFFGGLGVPASAPVFLHTMLFATFGAVAAMFTLYAILMAVYWGSTLLREYEDQAAGDTEPPPAKALPVETPLAATPLAVTPLTVGARQMETTIGL